MIPNVACRAPRAAVPRFALSLLISSALAGAAYGAGPAHHGRSDTTRTVNRISISSHGIEIEAAGDGDRGAEVNIGDVVKVTKGDVQISSDSIGVHRRHRVRVHGPVMVVDDSESGLVRVFADADVPAGETIDGDVVAVFGSVRVEGHVAGNVAAVLGSVTLRPGAVVDGDVAAIGGALDQANGAVVNGESVSLGLFSWQPGIPTLQVLLLIVFCAWAFTLLFGWLLLLLFPRRLQRVARTAADRAGGSLVLGIASTPLVVIAVVLLLITVVGIPFALLLPFVYLFMVWAGQLAATYVLGCRLLRRATGEGNPFAPLAAGTLFVALFFALGAILAGPQGAIRTLALFFTLLGVLLVLGLSAVGTGAVLLSRLGSRPRDAEPLAFTPVPAAGPPVPAVPPGV